MVTELWIYLEAVHCSFRAVLDMSIIFYLDVQRNMITKLCRNLLFWNILYCDETV